MNNEIFHDAEEARPTTNCPRRNGMASLSLLEIKWINWINWKFLGDLVRGGRLLWPVLALHRWPAHADPLPARNHLLAGSGHVRSSGPDQPAQLRR